jgi:hypothetical protein
MSFVKGLHFPKSLNETHHSANDPLKKHKAARSLLFEMHSFHFDLHLLHEHRGEIKWQRELNFQLLLRATNVNAAETITKSLF